MTNRGRRVEPELVYKLINDEDITMFCAAPTVLISIANAPEEVKAGAPRGVRLFTAGAPPAAATIERIERDLGWVLTQVYGLTETAPAGTAQVRQNEYRSGSCGVPLPGTTTTACAW